MAAANAIIGRVAVHVAPDLKGFYRETKDELTAVEKRLKDLKVTFDVDLNLSETSKKHVKDQVEGINAKLDVGIEEAAAKKVQARMLLLSRSRFATIYPKVDELAATKATRALAALTGTRSIKDMLKDAGEFIGELDRALPKFAAISTAVLNLGASLMASTSNILSFGGSLAEIGGASLALPGIMGGLAIGVTAFAVAMKDFNKYVPNFAIGLGRATTAGQAWKHLQDTMSSRFWKTAAKPMQDLVHTLFPQFSAGMNKVSGQLGVFTGHLAKSFTGTFNGPMRGMFNDLSKSITVMTSHTGSLAGILEKLGTVGAGNLPRLAGWFGDISDSFNKWLGDKRASGELQGFVDTGVRQLKSFGVVLRESGSSLAGLAKAAEKAGGTTLDGLAKSMTHVSDVINGKAFQTGFTKAFRGADDAMRSIANRSGPAFTSLVLRLTNVLGKGLPIAGDTAGRALKAIFSALDTSNVENSFLGLIRSLDVAVQKLAPTMPALAKAIAGVTRAGSAMIESIAGSLAPIIDKLGPKVSSLADDLTPVIKAFGEFASVVTSFGSGALAAIPNNLFLIGGAMLAASKIAKVSGTQIGKVKTAFLTTSDGAKRAVPSLYQFANALIFSGISAEEMNAKAQRTGTIWADQAKRMIASRNAVISFGKSIAPAAGQAALMGVAMSGVADKVGLSNTVMGAMVGSVFPGWGTAIGAAAGAVIDFTKSNADLDTALGNVKTALADNANDWANNAKQIAAAQAAIDAENKQLSGKTLGDRLKNVVDPTAYKYLFSVITGGTPEVEKSQTALDAFNKSQMQGKSAASGLAAAITGKCITSLSQLQTIATAAAPAMEKLGLTFQGIGKLDPSGQQAAFAKIQALMAEADTAKGRFEAVGEAARGLDSDLTTTSQAADQFGAALQGVMNPATDAEAATDQFRASLRALKGELNVSAGFKANTEAASKNREVTRGLASDIQNLLVKKAANGASEQRLAATLARSRQAFIDEAKAMGFSGTAARQRARDLGLTPKLIRTIFQSTGADKTSGDAKKVKAGLDAVNNTKPNAKKFVGTFANDLAKGSVVARNKAIALGKTVSDNVTKGASKANAKGIAKSITADIQKAASQGGRAASNAGKTISTNIQRTANKNIKLSAMTGGIKKQLNSVVSAARSAGSNISAGLASGIRGGASGVIAAASAVAAAAIAAARRKLAIRSPSKVFNQIGHYVTLGFANGIKGSQSTVTQAMSHVIAALTKHKALQNFAKNIQKKLLGKAKDWEAIVARIQEVQSYVDGLTASIAAIGSPVEVNGGSFLDITENLKNSVKDAQAFASALLTLRNLKLNKATMDQLAQAGPEAALAAAQTIAQSGATGVAAINKLQGQLAAAATSAANSSADVVYNTGQNVAKGLLAGLKASKKSIEDMMVSIAKSMVKTIRKALKIKSPSKVFKDLGAHTGKGFVLGIESQVSASEKAIKKLGAGRPNGFSGRTGGIALAGSGAVSKNLYYYAAPGSSISSEEDLFSAFNRARSF